MNRYKEIAENLLAKADVKVNGPRPWDIKVHDERFYARAVRELNLGMGESYMDEWWDCEALDEMLTRLIRARLDRLVTWRTKFEILLWGVLNPQRRAKAFEIGERHYDTGNDLFEKMLDKRMTYTCGYWPNANNLDEAQEAKLDLVCKKIGLKKGDRVLDIGCGWGSWMIYAAEKYGAHCTGLTVSKEQVELGRKLARRSLGEGGPVEFRLQDYRDVTGTFDHVVSLGMFEHVGYKNYRTFFEKVKSVLSPNGLFLLHTIGKNRTELAPDPWTEKYIFPNSITPSVAQLANGIENMFVMEDWHNFGADYDTTLQHWCRNFSSAWPELSEKYSTRFRRMWTYFLKSAMATFRARNSELWQVVLSPCGVPGGYHSIR